MIENGEKLTFRCCLFYRPILDSCVSLVTAYVGRLKKTYRVVQGRNAIFEIDKPFFYARRKEGIKMSIFAVQIFHLT